MLALLLLCTIPVSEFTGVATDSMDEIELNHFYDNNGDLIYMQLIYYRGVDYKTKKPLAQAWRLYRPSVERISGWTKANMEPPRKDYARGIYIHTFTDSDGTMREIRAPVYNITHTNYDPELINRELLAKEKRTDLSKPSPIPLRSVVAKLMQGTAP